MNHQRGLADDDRCAQRLQRSTPTHFRIVFGAI